MCAKWPQSRDRNLQLYKYELKRAFGLLEIYYNVFDPETKGNYRSYNNDLL